MGWLGDCNTIHGCQVENTLREPYHLGPATGNPERTDGIIWIHWDRYWVRSSCREHLSDQLQWELASCLLILENSAICPLIISVESGPYCFRASSYYSQSERLFSIQIAYHHLQTYSYIDTASTIKRHQQIHCELIPQFFDSRIEFIHFVLQSPIQHS